MIIFCSLLVMGSLTAQSQEIPPIQKGNSEVRIPIENTKVRLYSQMSNDSMVVDETRLIYLILNSEVVWCRIDSTEEGKTKSIELSFPENEDDVDQFSGAYFQGDFSQENPKEIILRFTEFDSIETYDAVFKEEENKEIIQLLNKILELAKEIKGEEDNAD
jgi:hypothetical protein